VRQDDEHFLGLLRREQGRLFRLARMLLGQEDDAWDLVQEATVEAYAHYPSLRGGDSVFGLRAGYCPWMTVWTSGPTPPRDLRKALTCTCCGLRWPDWMHPTGRSWPSAAWLTWR